MGAADSFAQSFPKAKVTLVLIDHPDDKAEVTDQDSNKHLIPVSELAFHLAVSHAAKTDKDLATRMVAALESLPFVLWTSKAALPPR